MSKFSIKLIFFTLSIIGIICLPFLSYKLVPDNSYPSLHVSFSWTNASQSTIEKKITSKLEGAFSTIKNIKNVNSKSYAGFGEVFLEYDKTADIEKERFNLSSIIREIYSGLPKEVSYPKIFYQRPDNNDIRLLSYSIVSKNSNQNIKRFINKILTPQITSKKGVNSIKFEGIPSNYYEIKYNPSLAKTYGFTNTELVSTLSLALTSESLGSIADKSDSKKQKLIVQFNNDLENIRDLENLPLKKINSKIIRLKDIASIEKKNTEAINLFRINGLKTINFSVIADKSANQITLSNTIKEAILEIKSKNDSYDYILTTDSTNFLKEELKSILFRTLLSFFFLFLLTLLIYRSFRYALMLFTSLIVTLLISIIFFKAFKIDIHIYSLMSLAISIGFVIDNSIIAIDHYLKKRDRKIILPIFAATLTTIAPLLLVTILDDSIKLNLIDFSWALVIVLVSSLIVSFFFIPAIIRLKKSKRRKINFKSKRRIILLNNFYLNRLLFLKRFKIILIFGFIILFGLPLFLLPENVKGDSLFDSVYNKTFGSEYYTDKIRPHTDKYLGGVLKLFIENSSNTNFIDEPKRLSVTVRITTPFGSSISYIDKICNKFEESLKLNKSLGVDFFQTQIYGKRDAQIEIYFEREQESSSFPFKLKGFLEKESLTMSGVDFGIFGVGKPFGTASGEALDSSIILSGYDYEKLNDYAQIVKKELEDNVRIDNILLRSEASWFANTNKKYAIKNYTYESKAIFNSLSENFSSKTIGNYKIEEDKAMVKLVSSVKNKNSFFSISNTPFFVNDSVFFKPKYNLNFHLINTPDKIVKYNQDYQLVLQYQFKGTYKHSELVRTEVIEKHKKSLVSGFNIRDGAPDFFGNQGKELPLPLIACFFIIFCICAILLESFKKSLLIILIIPISFIGVFMSLYVLEIGFNQGVYGALILLVGLLVNSSIFIINEFVNYNKKFKSHSSYIKAFNKKIVPVIITIISTIVGLIPFLISDTTNNFWYPFAITISVGLIFSLFVLVFVLPIYLISNKEII
jgi:multidrug efflux pump subunit AcrB